MSLNHSTGLYCTVQRCELFENDANKCSYYFSGFKKRKWSPHDRKGYDLLMDKKRPELKSCSKCINSRPCKHGGQSK